MRNYLFSITATLILATTIAGDVPTADDVATPAPPASAAADEASEARAEFDRLASQWKSLLKEMRDLKFRFVRLAEDAETDGLRSEFMERREQCAKTVQQMREAAHRAFAANPKANADVAQLLNVMVRDDVAADRYESAYETAKVLVENDPSQKAVLDYGAIAAFGVQKFDVMKEWVDLAAAAGTLNLAKEHMDYLEELPEWWEEEKKIRAREAEADDLPRVRLQTTAGNLVLELFENEAPDTVGNFVSLVEKGFYDGTVFHRVLPAFMAQGGCPRGDGTGGPGYSIYCECYKENHRRHFRGSLSMAKPSPPNTGGSQFFLAFLATPHLNGKHTVFGRVIEGIDVLSKIQRVDPNQPAVVEVDRIVKATVIRKRDHVYAPHRVEDDV